MGWGWWKERREGQIGQGVCVCKWKKEKVEKVRIRERQGRMEQLVAYTWKCWGMSKAFGDRLPPLAGRLF